MSSAFREDIRLAVTQAVLERVERVISRKMRTESRSAAAMLTVLKKLIEKLRSKTQEIYTPGPPPQVDMMIGGRIAIDFRSPDEFDIAEETAKFRLSFLPRVSHYILTDWNYWRIYRVVRSGSGVANVSLQLIFEGKRDAALVELEEVLDAEIYELKVPQYPTIMKALYTIDIKKSRESMMKVLNFALNDKEVASLFETYKKIMEMLYRRGSPDFMKDLFVRHTLVHMMVMASLFEILRRAGLSESLKGDDEIAITSGNFLPDGLNVTLPYLNWWKAAFDRLPKEHQKVIRSIASDIAIKARMVDWNLNNTFYFRTFYGFLTKTRVKKRIGEYPTPEWLVERILSEFKLKDKIVMDPFCGTGTFLVKAFHQKLEEGEDVDKAYEELVGFDINPLAVAITRAHLILSYVRATRNLPSTPPRVYHVDTLAVWVGGSEHRDHPITAGPLEPYLTEEIFHRLSVDTPTSTTRTQLLDGLSNIESLLATGISMYKNHENFEEELTNYMIYSLRNENGLEAALKGVIMKSNLIRDIAALARRYNGDETFAVAFTSSILYQFADTYIEPDIIVSTPPWIVITHYKSGYAKDIYEFLRHLIVSELGIFREKANIIVSGSDVSIMALYEALEKATEGVGFVMNKTQAFDASSPSHYGVITTYAVLKYMCEKDCLVKLIDVQYDAFGHGIEPALVIAKMGTGKADVELYVIRKEPNEEREYTLSSSYNFFENGANGYDQDNTL